MIFYYAIITIAAVCIGFALAFLVNPGLGVKVLIPDNVAFAAQQSFETMQHNGHGLSQLLLGMIPHNPINALETNNIYTFI